MNGEALREVLRSEMAATNPPPPMSAAVVIGAAKRARLRRGAVWACAGSAAVVLAVVGVVAVSATPGADGGYNAAGPMPGPTSSGTAEPMPTGPDGQPQEDRTARAGARYDQGLKLLDAIISAVPAGYTAAENRPSGGIPLRYHQANFEGKENGVDEVWSYMSWVAVAQDQRMGRLLVEVHTAGNKLTGDACALAPKFWGMEGECQIVTVGAVQVGVIVRPTNDNRFDQWAAYRHPDGSVIYVAQSTKIAGDESRPGLLRLPFSVEQLAALAVDERFHLP